MLFELRFCSVQKAKTQVKCVYQASPFANLKAQTQSKKPGPPYNSGFYYCRYLFVNYNAWNYVGCDILWAGIVKNLAEKIEEEFGVFTTRLFRSISLEKESRTGFDQRYSKDNRLLVLKFSERLPANDNDYKQKLKQKLENIGGQSEYCMPFEKWFEEKSLSGSYDVNKTDDDDDEEKNCWVIKYKMASDAEKAFERLDRFYKDIQPSFISPRASWKRPRCMKNVCCNISKCRLRHTNLLYVVALVCVFISSTSLFVVSFDSKKNDTSTPKVCFLSYS